MLLSLFIPFLFAITPALSQTDLECPDGDLQTYLLALIDALYAHGLTGYEDIVVSLSETDAGYQLLESLYTAPFLTILPPVDSALHLAGIQAPYTDLGNDTLANLFAFHTLQGDWGYDQLPKGPLKGVANSTLGMTGSDGGSSDTFKGQVMQQGDEGRVSIRMVVGNSTSWSGTIDMSFYPVLSNLRILPVDAVIALPPRLTDALTLPTSSRSPNGFTQFQILFPGGLGEVEKVSTKGGYTFFVPVDDAFGSSQGVEETHYSSSGAVWSPQWSESGISSLVLESGDIATLTYNGTGSYVSLEGGSSAQILRSDISLENGVMHIIDTVLTGPGGASTSIPDKSTNPNPNPNQPENPSPLNSEGGDLTDVEPQATGTAGTPVSTAASGGLPTEDQVAGTAGTLGSGTVARYTTGITIALGGLGLALLGAL